MQLPINLNYDNQASAFGMPFPSFGESQDELEQCRISCYKKHIQATQVTRGKTGPKDPAGPVCPKSFTGFPGEKGPNGSPG